MESMKESMEDANGMDDMKDVKGSSEDLAVDMTPPPSVVHDDRHPDIIFDHYHHHDDHHQDIILDHDHHHHHHHDHPTYLDHPPSHDDFSSVSGPDHDHVGSHGVDAYPEIIYDKILP